MRAFTRLPLPKIRKMLPQSRTGQVHLHVILGTGAVATTAIAELESSRVREVSYADYKNAHSSHSPQRYVSMTS